MASRNRLLGLLGLLGLWLCAAEWEDLEDQGLLQLHETGRSLGSNLVVVSGCISKGKGPYAEVCAIAKQNFNFFCARHGYRLVFFEEKQPGAEDRKPTWSKVIALQKVMQQPGVEYLFWMDSDSLFMNFGQGLETLLPRGGAHLSFSGDWLCFLNAGHIMLRNDAWTKSLLTDAWNLFPPPKWWDEQSALIYLLWNRTSSDMAEQCRWEVRTIRKEPLGCCNGTGLRGVDLRPQDDMNAYGFKAGDLIMHFPGVKPKVKAQKMKGFAARVLDPKSFLQMDAQIQALKDFQQQDRLEADVHK